MFFCFSVSVRSPHQDKIVWHLSSEMATLVVRHNTITLHDQSYFNPDVVDQPSNDTA